jgi:predicted nuclease of predicted toxin-antitoxin system
MKFFLDHDVPDHIFAFLIQRGHAVIRLRDVLPVDTTDEDVFAFAQRERAIMVSCNRNHFLALASSNHPNHGLIVLVRRKNRHQESARFLRLLTRAGDVGLTGNINFA